MSGKKIHDFEATHGAPKMRRLEKELAVEREKVQALAGHTEKVRIAKTDGNTVLFGLYGDTHYGSLCHNHAAHDAYFDYAVKQRGVREFYHTGDVTDGHRVYRGQEFELRDVGMAAQVARFAELAPKHTGVRVHYILGNHDLSFKVQAGANIGEAMSAARPDWDCLGSEVARVRFDFAGGKHFDMMLLHPGGGTSYALSYRGQKIVEQLESGAKPDLLAIGHYHKAEMIPSYRNVCVVQTGTFQNQTPFMTRQGLSAHVGGWIIEVTVGKGANVIRAEFVAFYR